MLENHKYIKVSNASSKVEFINLLFNLHAAPYSYPTKKKKSNHIHIVFVCVAENSLIFICLHCAF